MYVSFASEGFWEAFQKMGAPVCKSLLKEALTSNKMWVGNTGSHMFLKVRAIKMGIMLVSSLSSGLVQ